MEKHSHEISDILSRPPRKLVAYGTAVACLTLLTVLGIMWAVSYPERVEGRLRMTTTIPPISVIANSAGYVTLYKQEGDFVIRGEEVGYLNDPQNANVQHITSLDQMVNNFMEFEVENFLSYTPADTFEVGEIQPVLDDFNETISSFKFEENDQTDESKIQRLRTDIKNKKKSLRYFDTQIAQVQRKINIKRNTGLAQAKKALQTDKDQEKYNDFLQSIEDLNLEITRLRANKSSLKGEIETGSVNILTEKLEGKKGSKSKVQEIRSKLNALDNALTKWKSKYYLNAPADGKITYFDEQGNQKLVRQGEEVMAVVPTHSKQDIIGKVELPLIGSGKVEPGQRVQIKFDTYPFLEYGIVEGKVKSKSLLPTPKEEKYILQIELPNGLVTSRGKEIAFRQNMLADVEIVTEEARLIERVFGAIFRAH